MLSVSFASRNHRRHASIIPISSILQTCHLIPCFGHASAYDLGWTPETIYDESPTFYLNPYLRHRDTTHIESENHGNTRGSRRRCVSSPRYVFFVRFYYSELTTLTTEY